uniref:RNA helicase n=1 Tax=Micromonas pusilla TaxID=38833 RepID=A0A7S0IGJ7_MICPS
MKATAPAVDAERDRAEAFNEQRRRRTTRALDWLILNCDDDALPAQFREEAQLQRSKRAAKGAKGGAKRRGAAGTAGETVAKTSQGGNSEQPDSRVARLAARLRVAGFGPNAALAASRAADGDGDTALRELCAALGPSRADALDAARAALSAAGAGDDLSESQIADILRTAQRDELASLPRPKHAPRGYSPAQLRCVLSFDVGGVVQLGAREYAGSLEIDLNESPLYPFELPSAMAFAHPALRFEECAAVNAALCEHAATGLCGRPFLADLLEWCEGGEVAVAVEAARERVRKGTLTFDDCDSNTDATAGEAGDESDRAGERYVSDAMGAVRLNADERTPEESTGDKSQLARQITAGDKSQPARPSTTNRPTPEERAVAMESRRVAASEQSAAAKRADALAAEEVAREAFERTEKAAARVAELEARAATNPRVAAESERLLRELRRREKGLASSTGRIRSDDAEGGTSNGSSNGSSDGSERNEFDAGIYAQRERLPAWSKRSALLRAIDANQVTIVAGETGCGKTTQLPQFILDDAIARGEGGRCSLICTQPRRISAASVASRVAEERGEKLGAKGASVGYKIRLESVASESTRILFVTTGVLLRRLAEDPLLAGVSHVIVDEVHERSLDSDFLLVLLRDVLPHRPTLRVVLMSATLNAAAFGAYFAGAAVATIPGFTHPVQEHYLEDILQVTGYVPDRGSDRTRGKGSARDGSRDGDKTAAPSYRIHPAREAEFIDSLSRRGYLPSVCDTLRAIDQSVIDYDLVTKLVEHVCASMEPGAILVFMPGIAEISKLHECLGTNPTVRAATGGGKYLIGLHSTLSTAEQRTIFEHPPSGTRKIVIATNIAETSITIDDVVYVVDSGKCKENGYDPNTRMQLLLERWVSRASAKQRRGRAGRVRPGRCFRVYTRQMHDEVFDEHTMPEIKRVPLEGLCLQIQLQRMSGGIAGFLGKALEPPEEDSIKSAIKTLRQIGALDEKENLTSLGQHLASLPVDVRVGKMLLYGAVLGCLGPVLTIAAVLGGRSPFVAPLDKRADADAAKRMFAEDQSDHLTNLNAFNAWLDARALGKGAETAFTRDNFLSFRTLEGIADLRAQFAQLLHEAGFLGTDGKSRGGGRGRGAGGRGARGVRTIPAPRGAAGSDTSAPSPPPPAVAESAQSRFNPRRWGRRGAPPPDDPIWLEANRNSNNTRLVKAVLVAGLYPNLVKVGVPHKPSAPPRLHYLSDEGKEESLQVHPSSVNYGAKKYASRWLVYHERVQTTGVYVRDCSTVTPYQLLLFGGKIEVRHAEGTLSLDRWATFKAPARVGVLLKEIRARLDGVLRDKIERPDEDVFASGGPVVEAILQLLNTEPATAAPTNPNSVYS